MNKFFLGIAFGAAATVACAKALPKIGDFLKQVGVVFEYYDPDEY